MTSINTAQCRIVDMQMQYAASRTQLAVREATMPKKSKSSWLPYTFRHTDRAATGHFSSLQLALQGIRYWYCQTALWFPCSDISVFSSTCLLFLLRAVLWSQPSPYRLFHLTTCTNQYIRQLISSSSAPFEHVLACMQLVTPPAKGAPPHRAASRHCPSKLSTTSCRTLFIRGLVCQDSQRFKARLASMHWQDLL